MTDVAGHGLDLGPLDLVSRNGRAGTYWFDVIAEGFSVGQPGSVKEIVDTLMRHGDPSRRSKYTNRTVEFDVVIGGVDLSAVPAGEAALSLELQRWSNTLTWTPPGGLGYPTVFTMVSGDPPREVFDDLDQLLRNERRFRVVLECLPFTRSQTLRTFTWTGPGSSALTAGTPFVASNYLRFFAPSGNPGGLSSASINGVALSTATFKTVVQPGGAEAAFVPTERWYGQTVTFSAVATGYTSVRAVGYPSRFLATAPSGIGVVDVLGSAPAPFTATWTSPSGGSCLYTAPDPNIALRQQGLGEKVIGHVVNVSGGSEVAIGNNVAYVPEGDFVRDLGVTTPLPLATNPNGVWPTFDPVLDYWSFPADPDYAATVFTTTGAKTVQSANLASTSGYFGDAKYWGEHVLHPGRCGFAVMSNAGAPVTTTVSYYPHWMTNAGLP